MNWELYFSSIGGAATTLVVVGFLGRTLFNHWYKKAFKTFEQKLNDVSKRQEIEYSWLHQERAKVIVETYKRLVDLWMATNGVGEKSLMSNDGRERFLTLWQEARIYIFYNRLYFTNDLNTELTKIIGNYNIAVNIFGGSDPKDREWFLKLAEDITKLLRQIETRFQSLLAVQTDSEKE